jgi:hypothetical protein
MYQLCVNSDAFKVSDTDDNDCFKRENNFHSLRLVVINKSRKNPRISQASTEHCLGIIDLEDNDEQ